MTHCVPEELYQVLGTQSRRRSHDLEHG